MFFLLIFVVFLLDLTKSCPLTDNYLSRCHCGILTNGESYVKCDENTLDHVPIFKRSFPYDELILSNQNIVNLTRSSFDNIRTIKRIDLGNNFLSSIDPDVLRLVGNYLEELILTGDSNENSLEFLTRYPLKKLRILKLNKFDLRNVNLEQIFVNMTKLETVEIRSSQITKIPHLPHVQRLDLQENRLSHSVQLTTSYVHLNLAKNTIKSIVLNSNPKLLTLNLSNNHLNEFISFSSNNPRLKDVDLSENFLSFFDFSMFNEQFYHLKLDSNRFLSMNFNDLPRNLRTLSLKNNFLKQLKYSSKNSSLISLNLASNQLKTVERNSMFENLKSLNVDENPLQCDCHLDWLNELVRSGRFNASRWTCQSFDFEKIPFVDGEFQCSTTKIGRIADFNVTFVEISAQNGLLVRWKIDDESKTIDFVQLTVDEPFYLSSKFHRNQTEIFLTNQIQPNQRYHVCLLLFHRYARDKYCREIFTDKLTVLLSTDLFNEKKNSFQTTMNFHLMLIGSAIGGLLTFLVIFTCCYLCFQLHKIQSRKARPKSLYQHPHLPFYSTNQNLHYPIYHSHSTTCPYHQENTSNSTDSSQIDASLSTTNTNHFKHIYQTIEDRDYPTLRQQTELFDLWNKSLKHKR